MKASRSAASSSIDPGLFRRLTGEDRAYQRTTLAITLGILLLAVGQGIRAVQVGSMQLLKDATDWGYDVVLYGIAMLTFGRGLTAERLAALAVAGVMFVAGCHTLWDIADKIVTNRQPDAFVAGFSAVSAIAVAIIVVSLLFRFRRSNNPLIQATWLSSRNDAVSTTGFALTGLGVKLLPMRWPELALDLLTVGLSFQATWLILRDLRRTRAEHRP